MAEEVVVGVREVVVAMPVVRMGEVDLEALTVARVETEAAD